MAALLVHPSLGSRDGAVNVERSLHVPVDFTTGPLAATLTAGQQVALLDRHPTGLARFWGTYAHNAAKIARVREGDVVLFTGRGHCWAVGVMGYRFDNADFAQVLWRETQGKGTYQHVYALAAFEYADIPYEAINQPLGLKPSNHFQSMTVYDRGGKAEAIMDALHLQVPSTAYDLLDDAVAVELADEVRFAPIEEVWTPVAVATIDAQARLFLRGEAMLVQAYAASLRGASSDRCFTAAGVTDMCVHTPDGLELIEAKSAADRGYVRQALAQLLHYAPHVRPRPVRASALFPVSPDAAGVALLHRYGIDCIYRSGPGRYPRLPAPPEARELITRFWS